MGRSPADDWRRQNQQRFLGGRELTLRDYCPHRAGWDHDHCEFCGAKFSLAEGDLHHGYVTVDGYHWVGEACFADFQEEMRWKVVR